MTAAEIADALGGQRNGDSWSVRCPAHDDHDPSLSLTDRDGRVLLHCHAGCTQSAVIAALRERGLWPTPNGAHNGKRGAAPRGEIVAAYDYTDDRGELLFQVVRFEPKDFCQRRPDGKGGWIWNLKGVDRVLYRLPSVIAAVRDGRTVYVIEGEKDADTLAALGLCATTNPCGAGKWRDSHSNVIRDADVVILPDNDAPGREHAEDVAKSLQGKALKVRVVNLPGLAEKGDVSDWFAAGHTLEELQSLVDATATWVPSLTPAPTGTLVFTSVGDLLNEVDETDHWLVDGILQAGGLGVVVGKPKAGKSTLARCLCKSVAEGSDWLGRKVEQGRVLYLALEEKRSQVRAHFRALGVSADAPLKIFCGATPEDGLAQLRAALEESPAALVVLDPLFRFIKVKDGNDYAHMTNALDPVLRLARDFGPCVLVTHHTSKGDARADVDAPLGSTAISGSVDTLLVIKRSDRYRTLSSVQRSGEDLAEIVIELDPTTRSVTAGGTRQDADINTMKAAMLEHIRTLTEPADEGTIRDAVEGRKQVKVHALRALIDDGKVERTGTGKKGDPYLYFISGSLVPSISGTRKPETKNAGRPASVLNVFWFPRFCEKRGLTNITGTRTRGSRRA
ncbi:MAG TPA: AAA family ATPase [Terriglobales bacterium]